MDSDRHFLSMSFDLGSNVIGQSNLFIANIRSFLGRNKEKLCFNLAKHWSVKQIGNPFSR